MKRITLRIAIVLAIPVFSHAQNIVSLGLDAAPLAINPAFTGAFNGNVRITTMYTNQWRAVDAPYTAYGAGVDVPVFTLKNGDYFAAGAQMVKSVAGDVAINNYYAVGSVAYHKLFRLFTKQAKRNSDLSAGLQAGYGKSGMDLSNYYFGGGVIPTFNSGPVFAAENQVYTPMNAGISFAQSLAPGFNYIAGFAAYNFNRSSLSARELADEQVGIDIHYSFNFGANWKVTRRLTLRPMVYYQLRESENDLVVGNEFQYCISRNAAHTKASIFLGGYYHGDNMASIAGGADIGAFRAGICYDDYTIRNNPESGGTGNGGFELMLQYIMPGKSQGNKRFVPCNRF